MHLLLYSSGLVSKQCIDEVGCSDWMETDPELVVPCVLPISWKTETSSFHSELFLAFRDSQSACTFRALGRCSADIAICLLSK